MSARAEDLEFALYPARYFRASPTYNSWVRLTAVEVQSLHPQPGFEGQKILFHLNHPIAFIRITGVITSITDLSANYTLFTIDDSSGRSMEVKVARLPQWLADSPESPSNTDVSNLAVHARLGSFDMFIDGTHVDIGTVVSAKGTLDEWRGERQLVLKRIQIVKSTAAEVVEWAKMAEFKEEVLNKPWVLDEKDRQKIDADIQLESDKAEQRERLREEHYARKQEKVKLLAEKMKVREEKEERRRRKKEKFYNDGALV